MKQFFKWLGKHIAGAMVFSLFSILFISFIVYAINYPSTPPAGEVAGGKFQANFNKIFGAFIFTGGTVQIAHVATENTNCTPNGLIARDSNGLILSCQGGVWKKGMGGNGGIINDINIAQIFWWQRTKSFSTSNSVCNDYWTGYIQFNSDGINYTLVPTCPADNSACPIVLNKTTTYAEVKHESYNGSCTDNWAWTQFQTLKILWN